MRPRNEAWRWVVLASVLAPATADLAARCSCDCCGVRRPQHWEHGPQCASVAELNRPLTVCGDQCTDVDAQTLGSTSMEYPSFCFDSCRASSHELTSACVTKAALDKEVVSDPVRAEPLTGMAMPKPQPAPVRPARAPKENGKLPAEPQALVRRQAPEPSPAALQLAKAAYLEAKVHAKAAGSAARRAKESYELVMRSSREMSEFAGRMIYDEIQREAGEQSKKALKIRTDYENAARAAAIKTAEATAKPYKNMAKTVAGTAAMWNLRAGEFATSAGALQAQASQMATDAQKYVGTQDYADAEDYMRQSHQLVEQSQAMSDRAASAHTTANDLQSTLNWYAIAGRGAAAKMMANAMPYDVAPPALPNTVFLQKKSSLRRGQPREQAISH